MTRDFNVIIEGDGAGYHVATVPALKGCHTQARSFPSSWRGSDKPSSHRAIEPSSHRAIERCLEVEGEGGEPEDLDFAGVPRVKIAK